MIRNSKNGLILQFFICHNFVLFSDRHQLNELSLQWFDSILITSVERLKILLSTFLPHLLLEPPYDFVNFFFLNFQFEPCADASIKVEHCWETNMTQSQTSAWLIFLGYFKKLWHVAGTKTYNEQSLQTTSICCQNFPAEERKNGLETQFFGVSINCTDGHIL